MAVARVLLKLYIPFLQMMFVFKLNFSFRYGILTLTQGLLVSLICKGRRGIELSESSTPTMTNHRLFKLESPLEMWRNLL